MASTDRIEKKIQLRAPRERVFRALSRAAEFGAWFGVEVDGEFSPNTTVKARIAPTQVDPVIAEAQKPYAGMSFELFIQRIDPPRLFSFRWHPYAIDPSADYSKEPTTLVVFELEEADGGTLLTVSESGFDQIPVERRAEAFKANEGGWEAQTKLIEKYLAQ